jgi:hypothetical protein
VCVDEEVAEVEVAVADHGGSRLRQLGGGVEHAGDGRRRVPQALGLERGDAVACLWDADRHVGAAERIGREVRHLGVVQRAQELAQWPGERGALVRGQTEWFGTGEEACAEERPGKRVRRPAHEDRRGDWQRQPRRQGRQRADLALDARDRQRAAREAEDPLLVDEPDRVVPALADQPQRVERDSGELGGDQAAGERLVDRDLRRPLDHPPTLVREWSG